MILNPLKDAQKSIFYSLPVPVIVVDDNLVVILQHFPDKYNPLSTVSELIKNNETTFLRHIEENKFSSHQLDHDGKTYRFDIKPLENGLTAIYPELQHTQNETSHALKQSEERFRKLSLAAVEGIAFHNNAKVLDVNDTFCRMFGYSLEETIGMDVLAFATPASKVLMKRNMETKFNFPYEATAQRKDGTTFPALIVVKRLQYEGEKILATAVQDISELVKTRLQLEKTKSSLEIALKNAKMGSWSLDLQSGYLFWSDSLYNLLNLDAQKAKSIPNELWKKLNHTEQEAKHLFDNHTTNSFPATLEETCSILTPNETKKHLDIVGKVIYKNNRPSAIIGTMRDITQQIESSEALANSESRFRAITENAHDIVLILDKNGKCKYVSPAILRVTGIKPTTLANKSFLKIIEKSDQPKFKKLFSIALENTSNRLRHPKIRLKHIDGRKVYCEGVISPMLDTEGVHGIILNLHDITDQLFIEAEREKLESKLRHSLKMETIGTLAGGIAHSFKNILNPIIGFTNIALQELPKDAHNIREDLTYVSRASQRASELVNQILAFSRQADLEKKQVNLPELITETLQLLRATLPSTVQFNAELSEECPNILADESSIQQVIMNLCTNAFQELKETGGSIDLKMDYFEATDERLVKHSDLKKADYAIITITDNGRGINQQILNKIFDPFFTTKKVGEGTGLGLSVAHGIIVNHGGKVNVYSVEGDGTTFEIFLPCIKSAKKG